MKGFSVSEHTFKRPLAYYFVKIMPYKTGLLLQKVIGLTIGANSIAAASPPPPEIITKRYIDKFADNYIFRIKENLSFNQTYIFSF